MATLSGVSITFDNNSIGNAPIMANAGIDASKLDHLHIQGTAFGLESTDTPATKRFVVHRARAAGTITACEALLFDSGTTTDVDFDLLVNNSSVLSAQINVVHGTGDRVAVAGTISSGALVAGDVVECQIATVTSSTGAQGPYMQCVIEEAHA